MLSSIGEGCIWLRSRATALPPALQRGLVALHTGHHTHEWYTLELVER